MERKDIASVLRDSVCQHAHLDERELAPDDPAHAVNLRTAVDVGR